MASTASTLTGRGMAPLLLGGMLVSLGQLDQAEEVIRALSAAAAATRPAGRDPDTEILAAALALGAGRPEEAVAGAEKGLSLAAAQGNELLSPFGLAILATSALRGGDLATAMRHVQGFQDRLARDGPGYGRTRCLVTAAQLAEARQDTDGAAELAGRLNACLRNRPSVLLADLTAPGWLVRFELARGNREHAEAACAAAGELAAGNAGFGGVTAASAHARGLLDHDSGALRQAAEESPDPWARASAAEDLGVLLIGRQDFEEAGRRLGDSLAGYDQTASLRDSRRVRRRLRGIGIRRRHFTHAKRPKSGWTSLTDTERAVSDLVAKGLTNQQIATEMFLSTHTVAFHLRQVFRKLDIGSRVHLARVFTEQAQVGRSRCRGAGERAARGKSGSGEPAVIARAASQENAMGSYTYAVAGDTWQWSDGVYAIHGFHRGEVVPTTALLLSHAHAADRRAGRPAAAGLPARRQALQPALPDHRRSRAAPVGPDRRGRHVRQGRHGDRHPRIPHRRHRAAVPGPVTGGGERPAQAIGLRDLAERLVAVVGGDAHASAAIRQRLDEIVYSLPAAAAAPRPRASRRMTC